MYLVHTEERARNPTYYTSLVNGEMFRPSIVSLASVRTSQK